MEQNRNQYDMHHRTEREELAGVLRLAASHGWQSGICNHFSLLVDPEGDSPGGVLINPQGLYWSEVTASSLLLLDNDGTVIEGEGAVEPTAYFIHLAIHRRLPQARCVLHAHPPYSTALMCTEGGRLVNCHQDALKFHRRIAYDDDFGGLAGDAEEGDRIAASLGNRPILLSAHHGITITGPTVTRAYDDFYYLENAARFQILAESTGRKLKVIDDETADRMAPAFQKGDVQLPLHFPAALRRLRAEQPDFAS
jgi:ribulose-5-phosphate 4-epimerase/fuculose-1-phosphate aldolase